MTNAVKIDSIVANSYDLVPKGDDSELRPWWIFAESHVCL